MPADSPSINRPVRDVLRFTVPLALASPDHLNCHVIEGADGPLLIDCGTNGSQDAVSNALALAGITPAGLVITHGHIDHWGCATSFAASVGAHPGVEMSLRFAGDGAIDDNGRLGAADLEAMERAFGHFRRLVTGVPEIIPLHDGQHLGDWEVIWTPGHDPGHICLWRAEDGVLLCGDLLLPGFTPNVQPAPGHDDTLQEFIDSLDRVGELPVQLVLPAHGGAYPDAAARVRELKAHHRRRLEKIVDLITDLPRPLDDIATALFGEISASGDRMLAAMETHAHLQHLRQRGLAVSSEDGWQVA